MITMSLINRLERRGFLSRWSPRSLAYLGYIKNQIYYLINDTLEIKRILDVKTNYQMDMIGKQQVQLLLRSR